jgi:hypothetical protein
MQVYDTGCNCFVVFGVFGIVGKNAVNKKRYMRTSLLIVSFVLFMAAGAFSQNGDSHTVKVEIDNNAFMCPNLNMKIKRTFIQRQSQLSNWKVGADYNSATFLTTGSVCNKDSILKIFVKESEYPLHIIKSIYIDNIEAYKKGSSNH